MKTSLVKAKTLLTTYTGFPWFENARTRLLKENAFTIAKCDSLMRKIVFRAKTSLVNAKTRIPRENVPREGEYVVGKGKNAFCRVKTSLAMAKTHLRSAYVVRNAENAFTEGKPVQLAKTLLSKANKRQPNENVARKCENAFNDRNRG